MHENSNKICVAASGRTAEFGGCAGASVVGKIVLVENEWYVIEVA